MAQQCLETAYDLPNGDPEGQAAQSEYDENHPMAAVNLFELFQNSCIDVKISPERKLEAENVKNEGNCLMKEEKYQEALVAYSRYTQLTFFFYFLTVDYCNGSINDFTERFHWTQRILCSIAIEQLRIVA